MQLFELLVFHFDAPLKYHNDSHDFCHQQCVKWNGSVLCLQKGQQSGERRDQSFSWEQEDLSGSGGTSDWLVAHK